jgi:hypothetical protein
MQVSLRLCWKIEVDDKIDLLNIDSAAEEVSSDEDLGAILFEEVIVDDALFLPE